LFALAAVRNLKIEQLDVDTTFLYGLIDEEKSNGDIWLKLGGPLIRKL